MDHPANIPPSASTGQQPSGHLPSNFLSDEEAAEFGDRVVKISISSDFYTGFDASEFHTNYYGDCSVWVSRDWWDAYQAHCERETQYQDALDELWSEGMRRKRGPITRITPAGLYPPGLYPTMTPLRNTLDHDDIHPGV